MSVKRCLYFVYSNLSQYTYSSNQAISCWQRGCNFISWRCAKRVTASRVYWGWQLLVQGFFHGTVRRWRPSHRTPNPFYMWVGEERKAVFRQSLFTVINGCKWCRWKIASRIRPCHFQKSFYILPERSFEVSEIQDLCQHVAHLFTGKCSWMYGVVGLPRRSKLGDKQGTHEHQNQTNDAHFLSSTCQRDVEPLFRYQKKRVGSKPFCSTFTWRSTEGTIFFGKRWISIFARMQPEIKKVWLSWRRTSLARLNFPLTGSNPFPLKDLEVNGYLEPLLTRTTFRFPWECKLACIFILGRVFNRHCSIRLWAFFLPLRLG